MTRQELIQQNSHLLGELHALTQPHIARMRAFDGWQAMVDRLEAQKPSEAREWGLSQLEKIKPLMIVFDTLNGENFRLNEALRQRGDQVNACLARIKELEKENNLLRETF